MYKYFVIFFTFFAIKFQDSSYASEYYIDVINKLPTKYKKLVDEKKYITNLKEFNKNGHILVFANKNNPKYVLVNNAKNFYSICEIKVAKNIIGLDCNIDGEPLAIKNLNLEEFTYEEKSWFELKEYQQHILYDEYNYFNNDEFYEGNNQIKKLKIVDALLSYYNLIIYDEEKAKRLKDMQKNIKYFDTISKQARMAYKMELN